MQAIAQLSTNIFESGFVILNYSCDNALDELSIFVQRVKIVL
jgi:hypothetical protein